MQPELMLTMHLVGEYTLSFNFFYVFENVYN